MKRLIIVLGVLILLLDAAEDGFVGGHKFVTPDCLLTSVAANFRSVQQASSGVIGQRNLIADPHVEHLLQMPRRSHRQSGTAEVAHPGKITLYSHLCSSGGLPLQNHLLFPVVRV